MIDAFASLRHYADHLRSVWDALPVEVRGTFWSPGKAEPWGTQLTANRDTTRLVLVAAARDVDSMAPNPLVYVEHGAGQTYEGSDSPSYAGGRGHDRVRLFLCPNDTVAQAWRAAYPTPAVTVGCPKLDRWHLQQQDEQDDDHGTGSHGGDGTAGPVVAVTFHWDCGLVPETRSAWRHYDRVLPALAANPGWQLLGHGHPRLWPTIRRRWEQLGVDATPDLADVLDRADVLVGDNTSALYEFASLDKPVVVLNAPWYRRHVDHGLRFWSHPPGIQVDTAGQLPAAIRAALADPPVLQQIRRRAVVRAYCATDGHAAERAATAIMEAHECLTLTPLPDLAAPR